MADDKTPPPDKKRRRAKPATASKAGSNTVIADTKVTTAYDSQSYGIFKMRLTDQSSQIKKMADYSEDSAIKLNDIYEILKNMKPAPYVSSLDTYFNENGYIPVKVINPCCDENSMNNEDKDKNKKRNKSFAEYVADFAGAIVPALAYAASLMYADEPANADAISTVTEEPATVPSDPMGTGNEGMNLGQVTPDAVSTRRIATPKMHPHSVVAKREPLTPNPIQEIGSAPIITNPSTAQGAVASQSATRPPISTRVPPEPTIPSTAKPTVASKTPAFNTLQGIVENPYKPLGGGRGVPANVPDIGMPGQGGGKFPSVFGEDDMEILDNVSYKQTDDVMGGYGITKDNTDNTILTARKINFVAKEIIYEANKFEFIDQSSGTSSGSYGGGMGGDLSTVAFNPQESAVPMNVGGSGGGSNTYQVPSSHENFTAKESAVIDMISRRESSAGDKGYDMILGDQGEPGTSALGKPPKPITEMTLNELYDWQTQMLNNPLNRKLYGEPSSAVGKGQFVRTTLFGKNKSGGLLAQMGITPDMWGYTKFDKNLQDMLILKNFKDNVGDPNADPSTWSMQGLGNQWEAFKSKSLSQDDLNSLRGVTTTNNSDELSPHADVTSKSASTTMEMNKPPAAPTAAPAVSSASVINVSSPAASVDEPWAAFHDMFDMLDDATLAKNPWV